MSTTSEDSSFEHVEMEQEAPRVPRASEEKEKTPESITNAIADMIIQHNLDRTILDFEPPKIPSELGGTWRIVGHTDGDEFLAKTRCSELERVLFYTANRVIRVGMYRMMETAYLVNGAKCDKRSTMHLQVRGNYGAKAVWNGHEEEILTLKDKKLEVVNKYQGVQVTRTYVRVGDLESQIDELKVELKKSQREAKMQKFAADSIAQREKMGITWMRKEMERVRKEHEEKVKELERPKNELAFNLNNTLQTFDLVCQVEGLKKELKRAEQQVKIEKFAVDSIEKRETLRLAELKKEIKTLKDEIIMKNRYVGHFKPCCVRMPLEHEIIDENLDFLFKTVRRGEERKIKKIKEQPEPANFAPLPMVLPGFWRIKGGNCAENYKNRFMYLICEYEKRTQIMTIRENGGFKNEHKYTFESRNYDGSNTIVLQSGGPSSVSCPVIRVSMQKDDLMHWKYGEEEIMVLERMDFGAPEMYAL